MINFLHSNGYNSMNNIEYHVCHWINACIVSLRVDVLEWKLNSFHGISNQIGVIYSFICKYTPGSIGIAYPGFTYLCKIMTPIWFNPWYKFVVDVSIPGIWYDNMYTKFYDAYNINAINWERFNKESNGMSFLSVHDA